jgi:hypothetical protein
MIFHAYINEIRGSRSKIRNKKSGQLALRGGIYFRLYRVKLRDVIIYTTRKIMTRKLIVGYFTRNFVTPVSPSLTSPLRL